MPNTGGAPRSEQALQSPPPPTNRLLLQTESDDSSFWISSTSSRQTPLPVLCIYCGIIVVLGLSMYAAGCTHNQMSIAVSWLYLGIICSPLQMVAFLSSGAIAVSIVFVYYLCQEYSLGRLEDATLGSVISDFVRICNC